MDAVDEHRDRGHRTRQGRGRRGRRGRCWSWLMAPSRRPWTAVKDAIDNRGATTEDVPAPPDGEVTGDGTVAPRRQGDSTEVSSGRPARGSVEIGDALGREALAAGSTWRSEAPERLSAAAVEPLKPIGALLPRPAVGWSRRVFSGWLRRKRRAARRPRSGHASRGEGGRAPPRSTEDLARTPGLRERGRRRADAGSRGPWGSPLSTDTITPVKDDAAQSRNAATAPNSSGSP